MLDYGPPINTFDMGNGKRAFQWIMNNSYTTPSYAQTNGSATTAGLVTNSNTVNYQTWISLNTVITGGQTINNQCVYLYSEVGTNLLIVGLSSILKTPNQIANKRIIN